MRKQSMFLAVYSTISALIAFIAIAFICLRTFRWNLPVAILAASIFALIFFAFSWFRGMKASDFPIYNDKLQLILPKRYWPKVLDSLQKYEQEKNEKVGK